MADLTEEFKDELAKIKGQVDDHEARLAKLEAQKQKVQIGGSFMYRTGAQETANVAAGVSSLDWPDDRFGYHHLVLDLSADINPSLMGKVTLWDVQGAPLANTFGPLVREAYVQSQTKWGELTLGRQNYAWGSGLLVDNQLATQDGARFQTTFGRGTGFQAILADADNGAVGNSYGFAQGYFAPPAEDDEYFALRLDGKLLGADVGVNWLGDGMRYEKAYSVDLGFDIWGRRVTGEWATLDQNAAGMDTDAQAFTVKAELWNSPNLKVWAAYTDTDQGNANPLNNWVAPIASVRNPYVRTAAEAIWDRGGYGATLIPERPLVQNIYDVGVAWNLFGKYPLDIRYYGGEDEDGAGAGEAYSVAYTHPVAEGVDLELKYGKVSNDGADDSMIRLTTMVGF